MRTVTCGEGRGAAWRPLFSGTCTDQSRKWTACGDQAASSRIMCMRRGVYSDCTAMVAQRQISRINSCHTSRSDESGCLRVRDTCFVYGATASDKRHQPLSCTDPTAQEKLFDWNLFFPSCIFNAYFEDKLSPRSKLTRPPRAAPYCTRVKQSE